ncbi:hypothetical protein AMAG_18044, partial [Allomyces macrogynus ATCC 38327]
RTESATTAWSASVLNPPQRLTAGKKATRHAAAVHDRSRGRTSPAPSKATSSDQSASTASTSPPPPHPSATEQTAPGWPRTHSTGILTPSNESCATILATGGHDPRRSPVSVQQIDREVHQFAERRLVESMTARGPADLHRDALPESISLPLSSSPQ